MTACFVQTAVVETGDRRQARLGPSPHSVKKLMKVAALWINEYNNMKCYNGGTFKVLWWRQGRARQGDIQVGLCSFPFVERGAKGTSRRKSTQKISSQPYSEKLLKCLLSLSLIFGKTETRRRQVKYSAFHVKSGLESLSLYPWKIDNLLKKWGEKSKCLQLQSLLCKYSFT